MSGQYTSPPPLTPPNRNSDGERRLFERPFHWLLLYLGLVVLLLPQFVNMLRLVQFNVIPRDHYYNMLLNFIGVQRTVPFFVESPFGYRILNILIAVPFYLIPPFIFRHLPAQTVYSFEQLRASQAIVMTNYLCLIALVVLAVYMIYRAQRRSSIEGMLGGMMGFVLAFFSGWYSLDMPIILYISVVLYNLHRPAVVIPLLLLSAVFNEKIFTIFGLLFTIRLITPSVDKRRSAYYLGGTVVAGALYYLLVRIIDLPFPEHQANTARYAQTVLHNLVTSFTSVRGAITNLLPLFLLIVLAALNYRSLHRGAIWRDKMHRFNYQSHDYLVIPCYLLICMVASAQFNLGRLIIVLYPLYLFGAVDTIGRYGNNRRNATPHALY